MRDDNKINLKEIQAVADSIELFYRGKMGFTPCGLSFKQLLITLSNQG